MWAFQPTRRQSVIGDKWVSRLNEKGRNSSFELNKAVEFKPVVKDDNVQPSLLEKRWILIWLPTVGLPSPKLTVDLVIFGGIAVAFETGSRFLMFDLP